jgi:SAM-dependent methyltransferase
MTKITEEKRSMPRIKAKLKVDLPKDISCDSIDLSEGGLSFNSQENISSPSIPLKLHFPDKGPELKINAKLVWRRGFEDGTSSYGVEFAGLSEAQKTALREELIRTQLSGLLNDVKSPETKEQISHFFLKGVLGYINEMSKLIPLLSREERCSEELEAKLDRLNTQILLKGYCLEELLSDKAIMQRAKDNFRQLIGAWVYKSAIVKWAFEKPKGYPGDYKLLEIIYDNKPISKGLGVYFDNNFLKSPYAVALRLCKDHLRDLLRDFIEQTKSGRMNILNIACGSCREIRELLPYLKTQSPVKFSCMDGDEEALEFSQALLSCRAPGNIEFKFVKEDIMNVIKGDVPIENRFSKQDLVYSIGLIDYLGDADSKKLIRSLYQLLREGGKLILTHKNRDKTFPPIHPDWLCDWKFVPRNKDEVVRLFYTCGISGFSTSWESDNFGYVFYYILTKLTGRSVFTDPSS